jgi:glutamate-5-semialdehyde dehydrogenase
MQGVAPPSAPSPREQATALARSAREAARRLARASTEEKDGALLAIARALRAARGSILEANARDLAAATELAPALKDRLRLEAEGIEALARTVEEVRALGDPVGEVTETERRPNGLLVSRVRIPLGVILMVYEARPNVTADVAALCLKSGNAAILRGGKEALATNRAIAAAIREGLEEAKLPASSVQLVETPSRELLLELLALDGLIDLAIPRGGEGLIRFVAEHARVPVVKHWKGVCHVFLDATATEEDAVRIAVNAKTSRPGVCNAAECLLVHGARARDLLPAVGRALVARGVELRADEPARAILEAAGIPARAAAPGDFGQEFLALVMAVKVVPDLDGALDHIARFGSLHTEAIVTRDPGSASRFKREVEASCVVVNASTRFNDGGELGLGAEVGISTSKLHAFGPMGLRELTTRKFVVEGDGQVR